MSHASTAIRITSTMTNNLHENKRGPSARVLVIDGSSSAPLETVRPAVDAGAECQLVATVAEAEKVLTHGWATMVVVDAESLPRDEQQVFAAVVQLRQQGGAPVVVVVKEGTSAEIVESLWRAGADDVLLQPVRMRQVSLRLAAITDAATTVQLPRRKNRVLLFLASDEKGRAEFGRLLELEGFQLVCATADEAGIDSLGASLRCDCLVISTAAPEPEVTSLLGRLTGRWPELAAVPKVLIARQAPANKEGAQNVQWLEHGPLAPETVVRAMHKFMNRSSSSLGAHLRIPFFCLVEFRDTSSPAEMWSASFSFDLSPMGVFVKTLVPARPGTSVEFRIHLTTTGEVMVGTGVVAWANTFADRKAFTCPVGMGIQFLGMSPKPLAKLREICRYASS